MKKSLILVGTQWGDEGKGKSLTTSPQNITQFADFKVVIMQATQFIKTKKSLYYT